ncbi:ubiquitin carboxyl-terminal hydrolase 16 isoform X3 [Palaemon carinicauda]|uniref:ubiquitin carboxyl-terminal hydrolase 16 isoform X3 n=1 Tax=Palaemon carinicauda TaxID=392227 RepID=UPI0035B68603
MCAMRNNKRNSLPSLTMNKFFVNKRASMFERTEETPREKKEWSPCGAVETSQRKMEEFGTPFLSTLTPSTFVPLSGSTVTTWKARKEEKKKEAMRARLKRQSDPYAEESSDGEDEEISASVTSGKDSKKESKACGHANRSVNVNLVKRTLKQGQSIGECTQCRKGHKSELNDEDPNNAIDSYDPVIWLCLYCGHQGCDRNTRERHALLHYRTPRSDPHCLILNTQAWNVWCYECDSEIQQTSTKKLHEIVEYIKRQKDMAPNRPVPTKPIPESANVTGPTTGSITIAKCSVASFDDNSKAAKNQRNAQASVLASLPKVKGLSNLGNTCFFNSVMQSLAQTHYLTQLLDVQCQSGQRVYLPGHLAADPIKNGDSDEKLMTENGRIKKKRKEIIQENENEDDADLELQPLDLILPEGGSLTLATAVFLKEMHSVGKNAILNPGHLFGQICKKSTQFQGYEQQDAHELLRCLLDAIRNEEILRSKRAILRAFALSEKTDPNSVSPRLKKMIKGYGRQATHTIIDHIFGGHLISTVFCEECHWSSQVFEPFMDLSLPINEEKGKPKKGSPDDDDDVVFDCFGRSSNNQLSKHQLKKLKKANKKEKRTKAGRAKGGSLAPPCIRANPEDKEEENKNNKFERRRTEKSRPGEEEEKTIILEDKPKDGSTSLQRVESCKFKQLMAARKISRREMQSDDEESDDSEEEDDSSLVNGNGKRDEQNGMEKVDESKDHKKDEDDEEEDDDDDDDDEEEEDYDGKKGDESDRGSKKKDSSTEISDADIEDNTDSERVRHNYHNTRQPSIVVEQSEENDVRNFNEGIPPHLRRRLPLKPRRSLLSRCLNSCQSSDHLNYNSASETSERYFTPNERDCNGLDTGDDLENYHDPVASPNVSSASDVVLNASSSHPMADEGHTKAAWCIYSPSKPTGAGAQPLAVWRQLQCMTSPPFVSQNKGQEYSSSQNIVQQCISKPLVFPVLPLLWHSTAKERADNTSLRSDITTNTSGKASSSLTGDSISISSGDTINNYEAGMIKVPVDQAHMEEMCLKVGELKIRRKSCSKESLLDTQKLNQKRGSTETLHTFKERSTEGDDESKKKARYMKKLKQEWIARSLTTLAPRYQCRSQECSVMSCLTNFTAPELLTGSNKITCENCTKIHNQLHPEDQMESVKSNASKQLLILSPPAVLTLQLKRFHHMGCNLTKVNRYVQFPLVLDIAPFTSSISLGLGNMSRGQSQVLYGLYGVVEHSGRLNSGHYVAYVRSRPLDPSRTNKQYLNLKPSSQFEINQLVAEMAEKIEASSGTLSNELKPTLGNKTTVDKEEFEEEVKAGRWFHVSDTYVAEVNIERVMKAQAYLLFYERLV